MLIETVLSFAENESNPFHYRFASHPYWAFWIKNIHDRRAITEQTGIVCNDIDVLSKFDSPEKLETELSKGFGSSLMRTLSSRTKNIPGTRSYWWIQMQNLIQAMDTYGSPTIFFTLSAADYQWRDIQRIMPWSEDIRCNSLHQISFNDRKRMVVTNPHLATWYFKKRTDILISKLIPLLGVTHYWYRIENQHRGSDHAHGCLWLKYAPDMSVLGRKIKLGHVANIKLDVLNGDKHIFTDNDCPEWFQDKRYLFSEEDLAASKISTHALVKKFERAVKRDLQKRRRGKHKYKSVAFFSGQGVFICTMSDTTLEFDHNLQLEIRDTRMSHQA